MTKYESQLEWLFNRFPSYQKVGKTAYKPGIDTMIAFDNLQGNLHTNYKTIHIAGTNGKGSTSHMLAAAIASTGKKVGLYTSPHLLDFRERIRIIENNTFRYVTKDFVSGFIDRYQQFFDKENPSFFEITTAMAFEYFYLEKVDIAVIETGLGGRLDSTNVINPILSIITNIGLEHCEHLGFTLEEIAGEKAGIIKPGVPVVIGERLPETKSVFINKARECRSELCFAEDEADLLGISHKDLDLGGDYQIRNIKTLGVALSVLEKQGIVSIGEPMKEAIEHAAAITGLRGRWEVLQHGEGLPDIICDTGHNAHGFRWIREQIDKISCDYDNIWFIFGVVADKDIDAIANNLPSEVNWIFTQAKSPRALKSIELARHLDEYDIHGTITDSVREAFETAKEKASPKDLIFAAGSNFIIAELLELFN